jgi:16S rRNA (guanine(966)-N(2))-methyltransferase RsmD
LRIISGFLKGRRLEFPKNTGNSTRPSTDFTRESLFNILNNRISFDGLKVWDMFAGTGAVGLEFISRGASKVWFVDTASSCIDSIRKHLVEFKVEPFAQLSRMDAFVFLQSQMADSVDLIFADAPYSLAQIAQIPKIVFERKLLRPEGILVLEHDNKIMFEQYPNWIETRKYGKAQLSFFQAIPTPTTEENPQLENPTANTIELS